jgi:flagellar protein FliO/FliZ
MMPELLRAGIALAAVVVLIVAFGAVLRRFGHGPATRAGKRLAVTESLSLDARRRLVIVRHDGREHLLLLGPTGDLVVERGPLPPETP